MCICGGVCPYVYVDSGYVTKYYEGNKMRKKMKMKEKSVGYRSVSVYNVHICTEFFNFFFSFSRKNEKLFKLDSNNSSFLCYNIFTYFASFVHIKSSYKMYIVFFIAIDWNMRVSKDESKFKIFAF